MSILTALQSVKLFGWSAETQYMHCTPDVLCKTLGQALAMQLGIETNGLQRGQN
jgi:hypothetical protein